MLRGEAGRMFDHLVEASVKVGSGFRKRRNMVERSGEIGNVACVHRYRERLSEERHCVSNRN